MASIGTYAVKVAYTSILLTLAVACFAEVFRVWLDRTLYIEAFKFTKDGQDVPSAGLSFSNMLQHQQATLLRLLQQRASDETKIFTQPLNIASIDVGHLDISEFADVKVEASGVNITALLTTIRRWIATPNQISGSVSQNGNEYYVAAALSGSSVGNRTFALRPSSSLPQVVFDLSCQIAHAQLAPRNPSLPQKEEDFCDFARALATFDEYRAIRHNAEAGKAMASRLDESSSALSSLMAADKQFSYAWKLAAYLIIERSALETDPDKKKLSLDNACQLLGHYLGMIEKENRKDEAAQARLEYLRPKSVTPTVSADSRVRIAAPGRSGGLEGVQSAASVCCVVADSSGTRYLLTAGYIVQDSPLGTFFVSPAPSDGGKDRIGKLSRVLGSRGTDDIAMIQLNEGSRWENVFPSGKSIGGLAPPAKKGDNVYFAGRTSNLGTAVIIDPNGPDGTIVANRYPQPGDGGGPVFDAQYRLIGMTYSSSSDKSYILPLAKVLKDHELKLVE